MTKDLLMTFVLRISKLIEWWNSDIAAYVLKMRSLEVTFFLSTSSCSDIWLFHVKAGEEIILQMLQQLVNLKG